MARYAGLAVLFLSGPAWAAPSVADFMGYARYESARISPEGKQLAFTQRTPDFEMITVLPLPDLKAAASSSFGKDVDIAAFAWVSEKRIIVSPQRRFPGYTTYKAPTGEIFGIDANSKNFEMLFGYLAGKMQTGTKITVRQDTYASARPIDMMPEDRQHVIIETQGYRMNGAPEGEYAAAYRMDVNNGRLDKLASSPLRLAYFMTDAQHRVVLLSGENEAGIEQSFYRKDPKDPWTMVGSNEHAAGHIEPIHRAENEGEFYALDDTDAATSGVILWRPASGERRVLFRDPNADVIGAFYDHSGRPWAFRYVDHFPKYWYPDPEHPLAKLHLKLRSMFRGSDVSITSVTDDMATAVARIEGPKNPGTFYVVDVAQQKITHALSAYPNLKPEDLSDVEPFEFKARDGLTIRGYLTVHDSQKAKRMPTIVYVHGGPYGIFDDYGFDHEAQMFASRGYAVLQVNFRGSGGRGHGFETAGYHEWGDKMEDDITDAVKWAVADGVADPKRICIYGGSYGAYAALQGVAREPDLYRCAVGMSGIYDLPLMYERGDIQSMERGENYLKTVLGKDTEDLKRRSPVYHADKIHVPVFLIHGELDERAPIAHARRMRDALEKAGQKVEWLSEGGEAHGVFGEKQRQDAYERMLAFFAKNLSPEAPAP